MQRRPVAIKDILEAAISNISGGEKDRISRICQAWQAAVDKKTYNHARPAGLKAERLIVNVDSSAWMYELNIHKQRLLETLNKQLKGKEVKEIVLRIGDIDNKE